MNIFELLSKKAKLPQEEDALKGRDEAIAVTQSHFVNGTSITAPFPEGMQMLQVGMGCFWGVERIFWKIEGVYTTAVGYGAGYTKNPTYEEVCSGNTGHNELVLVVFDPKIVSLEKILTAFWEGHDPTQGMRQGKDTGTQYRSGIYTYNEEQQHMALESKTAYQAALNKSGIKHEITTEIIPASPFYYAEEYHQQYLAKNPNGYCGIGGTGVSCPIGIAKA
ncbi:MAG: peptide-methionine (S)-S-oxide reductase MsrA [Nitratireductor sp.]